MSRALIIDAPIARITATCAKADARISAIETLPEGYTRVVLCSADAAAVVTQAFRRDIVTKAVARTPLALVSREPAARAGGAA